MLGLAREGLTTEAIASQMGIAHSTVESLVAGAVRRLGARNRRHAVALCDVPRTGQGRVSLFGMLEDVQGIPLGLDEPDSGVRVIDAGDLAGDPDGGDAGFVCVVHVADEVGFSTAIVAAVGGAGLVAIVPDQLGSLCTRLLDELRGIDPVPLGAAPSDALALTDEQRMLLDLIGGGMPVGEAARTMSISRRTADRRLAQARATLGVATTTEAVVAVKVGAI